MLLPLPETPEIDINFPNGNSTSMSFKLFPLAPNSLIDDVLLSLLFFGISIDLCPDKYFPVSDFFDLYISLGYPAKTTSPPSFPAFGPISII